MTKYLLMVHQTNGVGTFDAASDKAAVAYAKELLLIRRQGGSLTGEPLTVKTSTGKGGSRSRPVVKRFEVSQGPVLLVTLLRNE